MRLLCVLLAIVAQGARGDLFRSVPPSEVVVHPGDEVTLECVTSVDVICGWKMETSAIELRGDILTNRIPASLGIRAREAGSRTDCTIIISNVDERYSGKYTCSLFTSSGQRYADDADVIIAEKPQSVQFLGRAAEGFPLEVSTSEPVSVQCMAELARPNAEIVWYLGNTQLYDTIEVEDTQVPDTNLWNIVFSRWNSVSTLTYQFHKEDLGKELRCRANHVGYDVGDREERERSVMVDVQFAAYRPGGSDIGRLYGFTAGRQGEVVVNFTANPRPTTMSWRIGDTVRLPVGGQSRDRRFTAGDLMPKNATRGMYALQLMINPVQPEDQAKTFVLHLENSVGVTELKFQIGTDVPPPPEGYALSGATTGGIVAAVLTLLVIVGLVA